MLMESFGISSSMKQQLEPGSKILWQASLFQLHGESVVSGVACARRLTSRCSHQRRCCCLPEAEAGKGSDVQWPRDLTVLLLITYILHGQDVL